MAFTTILDLTHRIGKLLRIFNILINGRRDLKLAPITTLAKNADLHCA
jgi:hypothetical protein